jgi:hypothetical protein
MEKIEISLQLKMIYPLYLVLQYIVYTPTLIYLGIPTLKRNVHLLRSMNSWTELKIL